MNLSVVDWGIMVATSLVEAALFAILVFRHRWKDFPAFTVFMGSETVLNLLFMVPILNGSKSLYRWIYYSALLIEFVLQLWVAWEIARIVLRPTGTWVQDARKRFIFWARLRPWGYSVTWRCGSTSSQALSSANCLLW
jgi:hypothetical protein